MFPAPGPWPTGRCARSLHCVPCPARASDRPVPTRARPAAYCPTLAEQRGGGGGGGPVVRLHPATRGPGPGTAAREGRPGPAGTPHPTTRGLGFGLSVRIMISGGGTGMETLTAPPLVDHQYIVQIGPYQVYPRRHSRCSELPANNKCQIRIEL